MKNREIAGILEEIADFLELEDVQYKPRAYRRAARNVASLSEDVEAVYERGELEDIEGVGASIAEKIAEYLETGELGYYEELKADLPIDIEALTSVEGVGPKTARTLYRALGVATLEDLERAAEAGRIAELEGFGERSQQNILDHLALAKRGQERMLLGHAFPIARAVEDRLRGSGAFEAVDVVGSFRRRRPTVGDLDVLGTASDVEAAMAAFCEHDDVNEVLARGPTKSSVIVSGDLRMDLRLVAEGEYGAGRIYFTGSKDHNIALRNRAIERSWKLNEYGLFDVAGAEGSAGPSTGGDASADGGQRAVAEGGDDATAEAKPEPTSGDLVAGATEEAVYAALDLDWIPPELREDTGEVQAAAEGTLPDLVTLDDVRGDLQMHTEYSDGTHTVREMAEAAAARGLDYVLISDHGPGAPIPTRLDAEAFDRQRAEVDALNDAGDLGVTVLQGIEAEITREGLVIDDDWTDRCDLVVAAMHGRLDDPTERVCRALEEHPVDILAHPSNRLLNEREPLDLDWDAVTSTAADRGVAIEINAQPARLDLDWSLVKQYRGVVPFVVSTDAHTVGELDYMHLGVSQARRGWCEAADVLNTRPLDDLLGALRSTATP